MIRTFTVVVAAAFLVVAAADAKPKKPKPWLWTTTVAAQQLAQANPALYGEYGTLKVSRCVGKGKAVAKHYRAFLCSTVFQPRSLGDPAKPDRVFVKTRANGTGQTCASLTTTIPSGCLAPKGTRSEGTIDDATAQVQKAVGGPGGLYQGQVGCLGYGAGFWRCWFGLEDDGPGAGHTVVVFLRAGPKVTILNQP